MADDPKGILYIARDDLKPKFRNRIDRVRKYCSSVKQIGSTTHLQVGVKEYDNGTLGIKVEAYPLQSLAKAVQYLIEGICQESCQSKYIVPSAKKANDIIDVQKQKQILAEGEYCPPLSKSALMKHNLETSCELRQFCCPQCYRYWWKTVPSYKPVSRCKSCNLCLEPLTRLEQFGVGRFTCKCNSVFFGRCQGSDHRTCRECGWVVRNPYIHPNFRMDDLNRGRSNNVPLNKVQSNVAQQHNVYPTAREHPSGSRNPAHIIRPSNERDSSMVKSGSQMDYQLRPQRQHASLGAYFPPVLTSAAAMTPPTNTNPGNQGLYIPPFIASHNVNPLVPDSSQADDGTTISNSEGAIVVPSSPRNNKVGPDENCDSTGDQPLANVIPPQRDTNENPRFLQSSPLTGPDENYDSTGDQPPANVVPPQRDTNENPCFPQSSPLTGPDENHDSTGSQSPANIPPQGGTNENPCFPQSSPLTGPDENHDSTDGQPPANVFLPQRDTNENPCLPQSSPLNNEGNAKVTREKSQDAPKDLCHPPTNASESDTNENPRVTQSGSGEGIETTKEHVTTQCENLHNLAAINILPRSNIEAHPESDSLSDNGSTCSNKTMAEKSLSPTDCSPTKSVVIFETGPAPTKVEKPPEPNSKPVTTTSIDSDVSLSSTSISSHVVFKANTNSESALQVEAKISITHTPISIKTESTTTSISLDSSQLDSSLPKSSSPTRPHSSVEDKLESSHSQLEVSTSVTPDTPPSLNESAKSSKSLDSPSQVDAPPMSQSKVDHQVEPVPQTKPPTKTRTLTDSPPLEENAVPKLEPQSTTNEHSFTDRHLQVHPPSPGLLQDTLSQATPSAPPTTISDLENKDLNQNTPAHPLNQNTPVHPLNQNTPAHPLVPPVASSLDLKVQSVGGHQKDPSGLITAWPRQSYVPTQTMPQPVKPQSDHSAKFQRRDPRRLRYKQVSRRHNCSGSTNSTFLPQWNDPDRYEKIKPQHRGRVRRFAPQMPQIDFENLVTDMDHETDDEECEISEADCDDSNKYQ